MGGFKFTFKKLNKYVSPPPLFVTTLQNYKKHKMGTPPPPTTTKQHRLGFSWNLSYENTMLQPTPTEIRIFIILRSCPFLSFFFLLFKIFGLICSPLQKQCYVPVISLCCYVMKKKISLSVKSIQKKRFSC